MATQPHTLLLGPGDHGRPVSAEEFAEAAFVEPWRYEREGGRLVVMAPEGQRHLDDSRPWRQALSRYWLDHPEIVEDVVCNAWVRVDGGTDRIGDVGVYLVGERSSQSIPERVPELMFEVVSPGQEAHDRDYVQKKADYFRLGVEEYIVIDRPSRRVTVFTRGPRGYRTSRLDQNAAYTSPLLPGLVVPLVDLLR